MKAKWAYIAPLLLSGALSAGAFGQNSEDESGTPEVDRCATVPNLIDVAVLDDQHLYLLTRGHNHYLMALEHCEDLYKAYLRAEFEFVPYGRQVCENDGSYVAYLRSGRRLHCEILEVRRVESRAEARDLASISPSIVITTEEIESDEDRVE